jgi:hypothetical protein
VIGADGRRSLGLVPAGGAVAGLWPRRACSRPTDSRFRAARSAVTVRRLRAGEAAHGILDADVDTVFFRPCSDRQRSGRLRSHLRDGAGAARDGRRGVAGAGPNLRVVALCSRSTRARRARPSQRNSPRRHALLGAEPDCARVAAAGRAAAQAQVRYDAVPLEIGRRRSTTAGRRSAGRAGLRTAARSTIPSSMLASRACCARTALPLPMDCFDSASTHPVTRVPWSDGAGAAR